MLEERAHTHIWYMYATGEQRDDEDDDGRDDVNSISKVFTWRSWVVGCLPAWVSVCVCVRVFLSSHSLHSEWATVACVHIRVFKVWASECVCGFFHLPCPHHMYIYICKHILNIRIHITLDTYIYIIWFLRLPIEKETRINASAYFSHSSGTVLLASFTSLLRRLFLPLTLQHFFYLDNCVRVCECASVRSFKRLKESLIKV